MIRITSNLFAQKMFAKGVSFTFIDHVYLLALYWVENKAADRRARHDWPRVRPHASVFSSCLKLPVFSSRFRHPPNGLGQKHGDYLQRRPAGAEYRFKRYDWLVT